MRAVSARADVGGIGRRHSYAGFNGPVERDDVKENRSLVLNARNAFASCEQNVSVEVSGILG
jgi:hypothetical protein